MEYLRLFMFYNLSEDLIFNPDSYQDQINCLNCPITSNVLSLRPQWYCTINTTKKR